MSWQTDPAQASEDRGDHIIEAKIAEAVDDLIAGRRSEYHGCELWEADDDGKRFGVAVAILARITGAQRASIERMEAVSEARQFLDGLRDELTLRVHDKAEAAIRAAWAQTWEP